ncbi:MAG: ATP-dependent DNA helicase RecG [Acidimicrobiales bacterium]|nr:ATP-dependent DNA helicase RecG [Acidimicrobiales bacterium]
MGSRSNPLSVRDLHEIEVEKLRGVGPKRKDALQKMDLITLGDLLTHYPRRYLDRTRQAAIADLMEGDEATIVVKVVRTDLRRLRGNRVMVTSTVTDGQSRMTLTFFNQRWRERQLQPGLEAIVFGKMENFRGRPQMTSPVVDLVGDQTGKIIPVYPQSEKAGVTSADLARYIAEALRRTVTNDDARSIIDPIPSCVLSDRAMLDRSTAMHRIHVPETHEHVSEARRRLIFDELFRMQVALVRRKRHLESTQRGVAHQAQGPLVRAFVGALPFPLTNAQRHAIGEIDRDLERPVPMHRLLQGDVGSGKTLVAVSAMLTAVDGGHQGALMAPTEVLAEQHHLGIRRLLEGLEVPEPSSLLGTRPLAVELLTSRTSAADRKRILAGLAGGLTDIVIGTHALLQEKVQFHSLGSIVIDEQHRFGVEQRAALREKNADGTVPDVLVMTATPIPRTAAMTVYGDLDVSVLGELPPGRTPIVTHHVDAPGTLDGEPPLQLEQMWAELRASVAEGRQAYVVCPLIDESEKLEVASAEETYQRLAARELEGLRVGLMHGRIPPDDKDAVMDRFRLGELDVLVSTTVIEVGVDVPNATTMVILDADRFGIAQLHQLRGRVGRGAHASMCWLVASPTTADGQSRIDALVGSTDGFELAEVDLDLRGEGTILGERQKGKNDLKLASLRHNREVVVDARNAAIELLDDDPELSAHPALADELVFFASDNDEAFLLKG